MKKSGKNIEKSRKAVEPRPYTLQEAVPLLQKVKYAKFDETVEVTLRLGVDPKHADQMVRGTVVLPHGLGKSKKVLVIASGEKVREAEAAGADFVGGEDMVEKITKENWTDFDALIATPDMMKSVGRLGKILGPKGLMPGSRMQITRRTSAGPVTAPGMKYSRRNADENRPGRMSRRSASRTTNPMPSCTETIRNSRRFPNTWKNRASP